MTISETVLEARELTKSFGAVWASRGVDLSLCSGEIHALIGPNGAGKTTVVAQLAGVLPPDRGSIRLRETDITATGSAERARMGIGRSYQISSLMEQETARRHVELALRGRTGQSPMFLDPDGARIASHAAEHIAKCGLEHLADVPAGHLAHGQRRQVELAMVTAADPTVLLLDEPMAGLGHAETEEIVPLIAGMAEGRAVLLVEHDMDVVFELAHCITVMVSGSVIASAAPAEIKSDPAVRSAYLADED